MKSNNRFCSRSPTYIRIDGWSSVVAQFSTIYCADLVTLDMWLLCTHTCAMRMNSNVHCGACISMLCTFIYTYTRGQCSKIVWKFVFFSIYGIHLTINFNLLLRDPVSTFPSV